MTFLANFEEKSTFLAWWEGMNEIEKDFFNYWWNSHLKVIS